MRIDLKFGAKASSRCMRIGTLGFLGAMALPLVTSHAFAQSCTQDFQKLGERRVAAVQALNAMKGSNHGKLDPEAACPKIRNMAAIDGEIVSYVVKNKDWCGIPDNVVAQYKQMQASDAGLATKACSIAV